jgi:hypothetical protein
VLRNASKRPYDTDHGIEFAVAAKVPDSQTGGPVGHYRLLRGERDVGLLAFEH